MTKHEIVPLTKEEMRNLMFEIEKTDEFDYMFFYVLKTTGRREGELYGIQEKKEIGRKKVGERTIYIEGKATTVDRTIPIYKNTGRLIYGVKVKDIDLKEGVMKIWVLKKRQYRQDETVLTPEAIRLLDVYISKNKLRLEDHVFRKWDIRTLQKRIKVYAAQAGITHAVVIHNFRHYFVTELKRLGWSDADIQVLTGHKSTDSLSTYKHIIARDLKEKTLSSLREL